MSGSLSPPWIKPVVLYMVDLNGEYNAKFEKQYLGSKTVQVTKVFKDMNALEVSDRYSSVIVSVSDSCINYLKTQDAFKTLPALRNAVIQIKDWHVSTVVQCINMKHIRKGIDGGMTFPIAIRCDKIELLGGDDCVIFGEPSAINQNKDVKCALAKVPSFQAMVRKFAYVQFPNEHSLPNCDGVFSDPPPSICPSMKKSKESNSNSNSNDNASNDNKENVQEYVLPTPQEIKKARRISRRMSKRITRSMAIEMENAANECEDAKPSPMKSRSELDANSGEKDADEGSDEEEDRFVFNLEDCKIPEDQLETLKALSVFYNKISDVVVASNETETATLVDHPDTQVQYPDTQVQYPATQVADTQTQEPLDLPEVQSKKGAEGKKKTLLDEMEDELIDVSEQDMFKPAVDVIDVGNTALYREPIPLHTLFQLNQWAATYDNGEIPQDAEGQSLTTLNRHTTATDVVVTVAAADKTGTPSRTSVSADKTGTPSRTSVSADKTGTPTRGTMHGEKTGTPSRAEETGSSRSLGGVAFVDDKLVNSHLDSDATQSASTYASPRNVKNIFRISSARDFIKKRTAQEAAVDSGCESDTTQEQNVATPKKSHSVTRTGGPGSDVKINSDTNSPTTHFSKAQNTIANLMAKNPKPKKSLKSYLHRKIIKNFGGSVGRCVGVVTHFDMDTGYYMVRYEDGDREEMTESSLLKFLMPIGWA